MACGVHDGEKMFRICDIGSADIWFLSVEKMAPRRERLFRIVKLAPLLLINVLTCTQSIFTAVRPRTSAIVEHAESNRVVLERNILEHSLVEGMLLVRTSQ